MNHVINADRIIVGYNPNADLLFFPSMEEAWLAHLVQEAFPTTIYFFVSLSQDI